MLVSHCLCGKRKDGFILKIHAVGFSGIVGIIWVAGAGMTRGRSNDGALCVDILCKLKIIAELEIFFVDHVKDKPFYIGHTTREKCN